MVVMILHVGFPGGIEAAGRKPPQLDGRLAEVCRYHFLGLSDDIGYPGKRRFELDDILGLHVDNFHAVVVAILDHERYAALNIAVTAAGQHGLKYGIAKKAKNVDGAYYFLRFFLDLDNYSAEGIQIFGNKEMQKFYTQTFLNAYNSTPVYYRNLQGALNLVNSDWLHSKVWQEARNVAPGQVAVSMAANKNIVDNAVKEANKKLAAIK